MELIACLLELHNNITVQLQSNNILRSKTECFFYDSLLYIGTF